MKHSESIFNEGKQIEADRTRREMRADMRYQAEKQYKIAKTEGRWKEAAFWAEVYQKNH